MRRFSTAVLCATLAASAAGAGQRALADSPQQRLEQAKAQKATAEATIATAEARLGTLQKQYRQAEARLELAARDTLTAYVAQLSASAQLAAAQQLLDSRAAEAYEMGPGLGLELLLGSQSPSDFASAQVYAAHVLQAGSDQVAQVVALRTSLEQVTAGLKAHQDALQSVTSRLQSLAAQISEQLASARAVAAKAGLSVRRLEAQQQSLANSLGLDAATIANLVNSERGVDQSALLALLGPTQGRGCTMPSGLRDTGKTLRGLASWYGPGFAGRRTATGAIFDPRLFTAANKELPLNVFLRVHYKDRCAIVLVNDRGPYGGGRSFDLSQGSADYLGYLRAGVVSVTADLLVPAK
jgi:peptidoglycan hydrolase CwlO-like protein